MVKAYYLGAEIAETIAYFDECGIVVFRVKGEKLATIALTDEIVLGAE